MPANNIFFPALNWLTSGFVYATLSSNWLTCHQTTELFVKKCSERNWASNSNTKRTNMYLKNRSISNYFSSPIKFSKPLTGMKFRAKFEILIHVQKQLLSVVLNHSKSSLFTANWEAKSGKKEEILYVCSTKIRYSNAQRVQLDSN